MAALDKIIGKEVMEDGDVWLVFSKDQARKLKGDAGELGLAWEGKTLYMEAPTTSKGVEKLKSLFEKNGFALRIEEAEPPETKPASNKVVDIVRPVMEEYVADRDLVEAAKTRLLKVKKHLEDLVYKYGTKSKPGTDDSILIIDSKKIHYQYHDGRLTFDEEIAISWAEKHKKSFPDLLQEIVTVNDEEWEKLKKSGDIPENILKKSEQKGEGHYVLQIYDLSATMCPHCGVAVKKKDKFCSGCGEKLGAKKK